MSTPRIADYHFGQIVVDNSPFSEDVIVIKDGIIHPWRRSRGHRLTLCDLPIECIESAQKLIIGTGYYGMMSVDKTIMEFCTEHGIIFEMLQTRDAVERFNVSIVNGVTVGAFHLSC